VQLLVRTWNVFHGRTYPETGNVQLERMIRLIAEGEPDVVCLQEVPLWSVGKLERWSAMRSLAVRTKRALAGSTAERLQRLDPRRFRSPITGQANAILLGARLELGSIAPRTIRRRGLRERRICQVATVGGDGRHFLVANVHASGDADLPRIATILAGDEAAVACGDFNTQAAELPGFSVPGSGIDHILVRGIELEREPAAWPPERRRIGEVLLSDHAPVEAAVRLP
jgi:endonuclease/exonuclease/phosphatase family metal-dependent hydrolase